MDAADDSVVGPPGHGIEINQPVDSRARYRFPFRIHTGRFNDPGISVPGPETFGMTTVCVEIPRSDLFA